MPEPVTQPRPAPAAAAIRSLPTGAKLVLILSAALLPLALIALFATLQTTRTSDVENHARLRVAAIEASRSLSIELIGDVNALRVAMNALSNQGDDAAGCARIEGVFAQQSAAGARYGIVDASGRLRCGRGVTALTAPPASDGVAAAVQPGRGIAVTIGARPDGMRASAFFPRDMLDDIAQPSGLVEPFGVAVETEGASLDLQTLEDRGPFARRDRIRVPVGLADLRLTMAVHKAPITSPVVIAMLLPIVMWIGAIVIAWFIVDRLLIRPLRRLRADIAEYRPGQPLVALDDGPVAAQEIAQLGDTFRELTRTVEQHESSMADGLVRQTKLTREVHHRVKNNLQVIASLINFHARSAEGQTAAEAYAAIQRRVDALAVVHRHHYAEMEENRGLELKAVVGELASNIRATASPSSKLGITLNVDPTMVSQDVAVAVSFLLTELMELAVAVNPQTQVSISVRLQPGGDTAVLRISAPALTESAELDALVQGRYGRIILGLSRQLRAPLHHDPLAGAYEIAVPAKAA